MKTEQVLVQGAEYAVLLDLIVALGATMALVSKQPQHARHEQERVHPSEQVHSEAYQPCMDRCRLL